MRRLLVVFFGFLAPVPVLAADVALVDDELGQALLVANRGLCYAVLPNHVSADRNRIALAVPAPAEHGTAEIFWRDPHNDLALAYVEGGLGKRCSLDVTTLGSSLGQILQSVETGMIKSVHFDGAFFDRIGVNLVDVDDDFISVRVTTAGIDAEVMQGLSGAMLTVSGQVAGIAIDASSTGAARFLRMDRIAGLISGKLGTDHPELRPIAPAQTGQGFRVTGFQGGDRAGVIGLEPGSLNAPWIAQWTGDPVVFEITLSNEKPVPVNRIILASTPTDATTAPRKIAISIDRGGPGNAYWSSLAAPDMSPTGTFEATTGGTVGRRLRIQMLDVWDTTKPVRLDHLSVQ